MSEKTANQNDSPSLLQWRGGWGVRFLALYKLEVRLTVWQPTYALLFVLWSGFIIATYANDDLFSMYSMFFFVIGMISLIGLFSTGIIASRVGSSRFDLLEVALPTGGEVVFARWLAAITALSGLLIVPIVIAIFLPSTRFEPGFAVYMVFLILLSLAFVSGVIWIIQNTVRIRRWMIPLFAGFWLLGGFIPTHLKVNDLPMPGANLASFMTMNAPLDSLWGMLTKGQLLFWFVLFYIGILGLFAGVMLWRTIRQRFYRLSLPSVALTIGSLGVMLFSGFNYTTRATALNQLVLDDRVRSQAISGQEVAPTEVPYTVTSYDLTFTPPTDWDQPAHITVEMSVFNSGDSPLTDLTFSLNNQFTIDAINAPRVSNTSVEYERDADLLIIHLADPLPPGETVPISLSYAGKIWVVQEELGDPPEATDFTTPEGVSLNGNMLWYPIPGRMTPKFLRFDENDFNGVDITLLDTPAAFHLTIDQPGDLDFTSNLSQQDAQTFTSSGATWAQLIGVKGLQTSTEDGVTVIGKAAGFDLVDPLIRRLYPPFLAYLQGTFPEAPSAHALTLQAVSVEAAFYSEYPAAAESLFVLMQPRYLSWALISPKNEYDYVGDPMVKSLFGEIALSLKMSPCSSGQISRLAAISTPCTPFSPTGCLLALSAQQRLTI